MTHNCGCDGKRKKGGCKKANDDMRPIREAYYPIVWVIGGPGCGKTTQCEKLAAQFKYAHISVDDLINSEAESCSERAEELRDMMDREEVPTSIIVDLLKEALLKAIEEGNRGYLIDGFPKEHCQGFFFEREIKPSDLVLYFECSEDNMRERLAQRAVCTRSADDNLENWNKKIAEFLEKIDLIIFMFEFKVGKVDANRSVQEVYSDAFKIIRDLDRRLYCATLEKENSRPN